MVFDGIGLLMAGGQSRRMGSNKALLSSGGMTWIDRSYRLLSLFCEEVFISCRIDHDAYFGKFPLILDKYDDIGPIAGLHAALEMHPRQAHLVLAVDMPLVTEDLLDSLCKSQNPDHDVTLAYTPRDQRLHPLCAIYQPSSFTIIQRRIDSGLFGLVQMIEALSFNVYKVQDANCLTNINFKEDFDRLR